MTNWPLAIKMIVSKEQGIDPKGVSLKGSRGEEIREPNSRRSNIEVIAAILRLGEAGKTEIMYSANMSYRQLQKYLELLVNDGFLESFICPNPGIKYRVTEKGQQLLQSIDKMLGLLGIAL
ncbi:MAG: winged helix-turn-helix domain-containing protein [Chloroflexota bacterium]